MRIGSSETDPCRYGNLKYDKEVPKNSVLKRTQFISSVVLKLLNISGLPGRFVKRLTGLRSVSEPAVWGSAMELALLTSSRVRLMKLLV